MIDLWLQFGAFVTMMAGIYILLVAFLMAIVLVSPHKELVRGIDMSAWRILLAVFMISIYIWFYVVLG